jgi:hypothetical protein
MACTTWCDGKIPTKPDPDSLLDDWTVNVSDLSNYLVQGILSKCFLGGEFTFPTEYWLACHSTTSDETAAGTELSGSNYARLQVTFTTNSNVRKIENSNVITSAAASAQWSDIYSLTLWDQSTGGNYLAYGNLQTYLTIPINKAFHIAAGNLTIEFRV